MLQLSNAGLSPAFAVQATDEFGTSRDVHVAGERPLTVYVDSNEVVTLMTLGTHPELLVLGYLRTQGFLDEVNTIKSVQVDWDGEAAHVKTWDNVEDWQHKLQQRRIVTTGCGQGTVFSSALDKLYELQLPPVTVKQSLIYALLDNIREYNAIYKQAGAVHGCGLCAGTTTLKFVEDVGRHNAADAIAGYMWLEHLDGADKIFYTTGRLTSEIIMKTTYMGIPILLSRSGVTQMGLALARKLGVILIARAKGKHFLVYNGADKLIFDAIPSPKQTAE